MSFINMHQTYNCYTIENKIMKMQMSKKKKEHNVIHKKSKN